MDPSSLPLCRLSPIVRQWAEAAGANREFVIVFLFYFFRGGSLTGHAIFSWSDVDLVNHDTIIKKRRNICSVLFFGSGERRPKIFVYTLFLLERHSHYIIADCGTHSLCESGGSPTGRAFFRIEMIDKTTKQRDILSRWTSLANMKK